MRFRFTIRDLLWLTVVAAVCAAWFADRHARNAERDRYATEVVRQSMVIDNLRRMRVARITTLLNSAQQTPPTADVTAEVFDAIRNDPDMSVKVRAMQILPFVAEREKAIDVLIEATHDRGDDSSGDGNVPLYAVRYLAQMRASRAVNDVVDWLNFLKQNKPYDDTIRPMLIESAERDLATLKTSGTSTAP